MFYTSFKGLMAVTALGVSGLFLIWKGIAGDTFLPRWTYILGGLILLVFPALFVLVRTETGQAWLGL